MTQTIVITSGKGGVGKTSISVNTAIELSQRGYCTCLFDADLGLANVNILLGIDPVNTLDDYIFGEKNLDEIIIQTKFGIDVIPGSSGIEKIANLDREQISNLVSSFSHIKGYDYFIIDTSSGISRGVIAFCLASTETIIVITSEATSLTDAYALLKVMALNNYAGTVKILINKSPSIPQAKETYLRFKDVVSRHLKVEIAPAGIILNDPNIDISVTRQEPALILYPNTIASQCIKAMVSNLVKKNTKEYTGDDFSEFWQRYFEFSLLNLSQPEKPFDKIAKKKTFQLLSPEGNSSKSPIEPLTVDQNHVVKTKKSPELTQEAIVPFAHNCGIFQASTLASPTPLLSKALELQARGELTQEILLAIFSSDPVLMVKALQMICGPNADLRLAKRVTTRHQLIQELGSDALAKLLSTTTTQKAFSHPGLPDTANWATSFWAHSYTSASLAESIAKITEYPFPEEAFIAGLIHDIGRLALQTDHPEIYAQFPETFSDDETLLEMEQRIFSTTHATIAAKTFRAWHFDSFLVDAVQYHTASFSKIETAFSLVKIVFWACQLTHTKKDYGQMNKMGDALFRLSPEKVQSLLADARDKTEQLANRFGISLGGEMMDKRTGTEEIETRFRRQAMEYSMLRGVLPSIAPGKELSEAIRKVFQAFDILFHIKPALCLMPDGHHSALKAVDSPDYFGRGTLADFEFSLQWEKSLVVQSYISADLKIAMEGESSGVLPLADRQLLRALGTQGFVCLPMVAQRINRGVIVFGIPKTQLAKIHSLRNRLEQFGAQAADNICNLEKN